MKTKPRKRHVQLELKRDKNGQRRGVVPRRRRAKKLGRPAKNPLRSSERHEKREDVNPRQPQHVTLRVVERIGYLRKPHLYRAIRGALRVSLAREDDFRIVHFSIQGNHIHLLCEAENKKALSQGMKGFEISAAKRLNDEYIKERGGRGTRGQVFADRYHVRPVTSVRQTRHCVAYVLNNWRHHGARGPSLFDGRLDYYSSAVLFPGWKERTTPEIHIPPDYDVPAVARPRTWLLAESWKRASPISVYEVPGD